MKIKLFCVHDVKASAYLPPFVLPTTEMAVRTFTDTVNDPKHSFFAHPEDYTLFEVAVFDDDKGEITPHQTKVPLGNGMDYYIPGTDHSKITQTQIDFINKLMGEKS